jgi:hypothetical protein
MYMKRTACIFLTALALFMSASCSIRQNETRGGQDGKPEQEVSGGSVDIQDATVERIENILTGNVSASLQPSAVYPARDNYLSDSKWGYIDNAGMFVIEPSFSQAFRFQGNGLAVAGRGDRVGLIDRTGNFVADPVYTYINPYSEGRAAAADGEAYVVLDENGRVISEKYLYIGNYKSGRAVYYTRTESGAQLYGYLDENGKSVIQPVYWHATDFEGNRAAVKLNDGLYAVIDRSGKAIKSFECWDMSGFSDGKAAFKASPDGRYGYVDSNGNVVIQPAFIYAGSFRNQRAVASVSGGAKEIYGLINENGKFVILPQYDEIRMLGEDRVALGIPRDPNNPVAGLKYALADTEGSLLTDFVFYDINPFNNGVASATDSTSTFFINISGKKVENLPVLEGAGHMELLDSLIYANIDQRAYYVNKQGQAVYTPVSCIVLESSVRVCEEKYKPNINYLVYYPVLGNMSDLKVEADINAELREMWTDISTMSVKPSDILDYNYESGFQIVFSRKDLLVLAEPGYRYPFGAAHGMPIMNHVHIDTRTGRFYKLEDLFVKGSDYREVLTEIVREQIRELADSGNMDYFPDSFDGVSDDQQFYLTEKGLNLYFQPYEIASFAAGFPTFMITFDEISDIINRDGEFWKAFN